MNTSTADQDRCHIHQNKCISWTAIFVGALTALGLGFLLNLLGITIELSTFKMISNGSIILAVGGTLGIIVGIIITMLAAGFVSGYLGRIYCPDRNLGIIYGFTTWVMALLLAAAVMGFLGQYIATYTNTITNAISRTVVAVPINQVTTPVGSVSFSTKNGQPDEVVISVTSSNLISGAFIVFIIFFIGALFTCLGAHWGMCCKKRDD
jgi:ABC-type multidrug transport system fused ATPase/permease subunit